jgi:hypothetical protein
LANALQSVYGVHIEARPELLKRYPCAEGQKDALMRQGYFENRRKDGGQGHRDRAGKGADAPEGDDVDQDDSIRAEPLPGKLKEFYGQDIEGALKPTGEEVDLDDVEAARSTSQKGPRVLDVDVEVRARGDPEVVSGDADDEGIDLDGRQMRPRKEAAVALNRCAASHAQDQNLCAARKERAKVEEVIVEASKHTAREADRVKPQAPFIESEKASAPRSSTITVL